MNKKEEDDLYAELRAEKSNLITLVYQMIGHAGHVECKWCELALALMDTEDL